MTIKQKMLKHYARQEPKEFLLIDVHQVAPGFDAENDSTRLYPNEDGLCFMIGGSTQLDECAGEGGVRLLIGRKMTPEEFKQALQHILEEVDLPEPRAELESIAAEAVQTMYAAVELVKVLNADGQPALLDGRQVYKSQKFATDAERAFCQAERGIGTAPEPKPEDPPDLKALRARAALIYPSMLERTQGPRRRRDR